MTTAPIFYYPRLPIKNAGRKKNQSKEAFLVHINPTSTIRDPYTQLANTCAYFSFLVSSFSSFFSPSSW
jgi:hypothetical protein